jgi:cupin fold WbuC family metalloprotein
LREEQTGVFYFEKEEKDVELISEKHIAFLKEQVAQNPLKRARICLHKDPSDLLHGMLIVHAEGAYIRPHRHSFSEELTLIIEGEGDLVFFDNAGTVTHVEQVSSKGDGGIFLVRLSPFVWHTFLLRTSFLVSYESLLGPFSSKNSERASWSPVEGTPECKIYCQDLEQKINLLRRKEA